MYSNRRWFLEKLILGHTDPGETDLQAAYRETSEEAGFSKTDFKVFENEKFSLNYEVNGKPKTVHYWLSELTNKNANVKLSNEHQDFKWVPLQEACQLANYEDMVNLLKKCQNIINEKYT